MQYCSVKQVYEKGHTDLDWADEQNVGDIIVSRPGESTNPGHHSNSSLLDISDWVFFNRGNSQTDPYILMTFLPLVLLAQLFI